MARKDLGTIPLKEWEDKVWEWKNTVHKFKQNNRGAFFCWHNFQDMKDVELPSGLQAEVEYPYGKTNRWEGKSEWEICIKCGKIKNYTHNLGY